MRSKELRSYGARLSVVFQDQRRVIAVLTICALAVTALVSSRVACKSAPTSRDRPCLAATVATQGADEHTAALNDTCFTHHGFEVELIDHD